MTEAAQAMQLPRDAAHVIDEIVSQAPRFLPEFEHVSLTLVGPDRAVETLASTTDLAGELDVLQNKTGEGPCLDARVGEETVVIQHAPHEQRWPAYIPRAVELGLRSQIGVRLNGQGDRLVGLNLYSTSHEAFDPGSVGVAEHFAVHAGLALGHVRREEQLHTAIGTRTIIGTAIGILMERHGLSQTQAFAYLVRQSSTQNHKLRLIATDLVEETERARKHR
ncbi:GAF and ANTAR domain-containing protein [Nocardioides sp.]|uniref:GAF and ANTAR domain-containing protein n=1 Tax=Nocardioides sp. TaxID=35761 RepID=UPI002ED33B0E